MTTNYISVSLADYQIAVDNNYFEFLTCQQRSCVDIRIIDDEVIEQTETFSLRLETISDPVLANRILLNETMATVHLIDNDGNFDLF